MFVFAFSLLTLAFALAFALAFRALAALTVGLFLEFIGRSIPPHHIEHDIDLWTGKSSKRSREVSNMALD
jgi:hypothetical protein